MTEDSSGSDLGSAELTDQMFQNIGRVAVAAVRVEACIATLITQLYDHKQSFARMSDSRLHTGDATQVGPMLYEVLLGASKTDLIEEAKKSFRLRVEPNNPELYAELRKWLIEVKGALSERDRLVHSLWQPVIENGGPVRMRGLHARTLNFHEPDEQVSAKLVTSLTRLSSSGWALANRVVGLSMRLTGEIFLALGEAETSQALIDSGSAAENYRGVES